MEKKYYFVCGLPRSGSTLLNGILNQNSEIHGSMATSLCSLFHGIWTSNQNDIIPTTEQQAFDLYKNIVDAYYKNIERPIIIDTFREWPKYIGLLPRLYPYTKLIFCMRDIPSILNSFEYHFLNKNKLPVTVDTTDEALLNPFTRIRSYFTSLIHNEYEAADYIYHSPELRQHSIFIDYDKLIYDTKNTINSLYEQLELPEYEHDFDNVIHSFDELDARYNNEGLHRVHREVGKTPTKWILPEKVVRDYNLRCFWRE